jgi:pimeloyl-ACP methyl ester carboxylesterase
LGCDALPGAETIAEIGSMPGAGRPVTAILSQPGSCVQIAGQPFGAGGKWIMPFADIDGQALYYIDQGVGFPILLGHSYLWSSYLWSSAMWEQQIEALSQNYRVIAPDLWGHGKSGRLPEKTLDLSDLARQSLALLDMLGIQQCALVGHSIGAMWGAELALRAPGRIKCLVLMNTYLGPEPAASRAQYLAMLRQIEISEAVPAPLLDAIVPLYFRRDMDVSSPLFRAFRADLANFSADSLRHSVIPMGRMLVDRADVRPRLTGLDRDSTLLSYGAQDAARPPAETQEMAQIIGCRSVSVPESGHISSLENPVFVTQMLLSEFHKHLPSS